jgi:hypothetical protein
MTARPAPSRHRLLATLLAITLLGLALRIAAAQGDYWLDEAWSALFAREAATPGRVFFAINHDNNHFLNTLWLQLVGWGSPPILGRALSIVCGTAAIFVAGLIGARRGPRPAAAAAMLFALSPIFVIYGSEARGYAPMLIALLSSIWIIDRELNGIPVRHGPIWLGVAALLGMLAHISMLFGIAASTLWIFIQLRRREGSSQAARATLRLMGRAMLASAGVLALIAISVSAGPEGIRMGTRTPFVWSAYIDAIAHMVAFTLGWPFTAGFWLLPPLLIPAVLAVRGRAIFYALAIIGLPVAVAILQPDNSAFPRYYLLSAVALLLLLADLLTSRRWGVIPLAAIVLGSLVVDVRIISNLRGQPGAAITAMEERGASAVVLPDEPKDSAVLEAAAASRGYAIVVASSCSLDARFLFAQNNGTTDLPRLRSRCGASWRAIRSGHVYGLSGSYWILYERAR